MTDILIRKDGRAGRITLNRPKALNAVTWEMIKAIDAALADWRKDDAVDLVIIDAAGDRAFAAGGDIVDLYQASKAGDLSYGRRFWDEEYRLNLTMARYSKPILSLMQGFTMGGGVGLSCHVAHRIVDESAQIAMPECAIGLIPDVGGSWLLAHAPGNLGAFLGLTGYRMGPDDAIYAGFADTFVPRGDWDALIDALCADGDVSVIATFSATAPDGSLRTHAEIEDVFSGASVTAIRNRLSASATEQAAKWLKAVTASSPLSQHCALASILAAKDMTLEQAFAQEYRFSYRAVEHGDFLEGIRAQVIDKDRQPKWRHASLDEVTPVDVSAMLAPLGDDEWVYGRDEA